MAANTSGMTLVIGATTERNHGFLYRAAELEEALAEMNGYEAESGA